MTAGRSAGTEQGQGREVCAVEGCGHPKADHDYLDDRGACSVMKPGGLEYLDGCMGYRPSPSVPPARDSGHQGDAASFRVTVRAGDPASADRLAHAAAELVIAEFGAHVQHDAATEPGPGLERDLDGATRVGASIDSPLIAGHDATGDQSGRDEAREAAVDAIAQHMSADYDSARAWVKGDEVYRESWRDEARELLSLPAVAALRTGPVARALDACDVLDRVSDADERTGVPMAQQAARIRRAAVETIRRALLRDGTTT